MADNSVFITGASSGAFTEAFSGLPPWATESTALQIEKYLRKSHEIHAKTFEQLKKCCAGSAGGGKMSTEEVKKVNDELERLGKNLKRNNEEYLKKRKRDKDKEKEDKDSLERGKKKKQEDGVLMTVLSGLSAAGAKVIGVNKEYVDAYDALYQSGINVLNGNDSTVDGFESLNQVVNLTGLRLETLQKVAQKNADTINAIGFTKFAKTISLTNTRLQALGFSSEAQAELISTLMEAETGYMTVRGKTADQFARDAIRLGEQFDRLSKTVGLSRQQLQENLKSVSKSTDTAMVFARYGSQAAEALSKNAAGIKDSGLRDMLVELAAAANPAQVKGYNTLVQAGLGDVAEQMNRFAKEMMHLDPEEFQKRLSSFGGYLEQQTGRMGNLANLKGLGGDEAAAALQALYLQSRNVADASKGQADASRETQASIARLNTEIESLAATAQKIFFPLTGQVNLVAGGLNKLNSQIDKTIALFDAQTRSWVGVGVVIAGFVAALIVGSKALSEFASVFGKAAPSVTSALEVVRKSLISVGGLLSSAGKKLGSTLSSASRSAGGIGSVLGRVGSFFARFLGPVAALYAAFELGQSIGEVLYETLSEMTGFNDFMDLLFSGIKGGVELVKSGIEWLGEKFSKFGDLIYGKLKGGVELVKSGIEWLGEKFSKFGDWIYGKLAGVGDWVVSGFNNIVKKINEFGNYLLDAMPWLKTIGEYFSKITGAIGKFIDGVVDFASSFKEVLKDILSRFANKMTFGIFGSKESEEKAKPKTKAPPAKVEVVTKMKEPAKMSVPKAPAPTTIASPSAKGNTPTPVKSTSTEPVPTAPGVSLPGLDKPAKTADINNLLSYQGSLLEQILLSTNNLVSVNKDILRHARISA